MTTSNLTHKKQKIMSLAVAGETERALQKQWRLYERWCAEQQRPGFPCQPAVYEAYFIHLLDQGWKRSSIDQARWAIDSWYRRQQLPAISQTEELKTFFKGLRRLTGFQQKQKREVTIDHIRQMSFSPDLRGLRDKTLFLVGFAGGFRRSEITGLLVADIDFQHQGVKIALRKSKTNQEGRLESVSLPAASNSDICPVRHLRLWLQKANIFDGYLLRSFYRNQKISPRRLSDHQVSLIVKRYMKELGFNSAEYSGHSLRAGCATFLLHKGVPLNIVAKHLRHKKIDTTIKYDRNLVNQALQGLY